MATVTSSEGTTLERDTAKVVTIAAGADIDPQLARHANRLAAILVRLSHDPHGDPEAFLDAVETSMSASTSALTRHDLEALVEAGIDLTGSPDDPQGVKALLVSTQRQFKEAHAALTTAQAATRLGVGKSRIRQLIGDGSLMTVRLADERVLPRWQFTDDGYVPGIATFSTVAQSLHPFVLSQFMMRPSVDLQVDGEAVTPVEWLTSGGDPRRVATLVADLEF